MEQQAGLYKSQKRILMHRSVGRNDYSGLNHLQNPQVIGVDMSCHMLPDEMPANFEPQVCLDKLEEMTRLEAETIATIYSINNSVDLANFGIG